MLSYFLQGARSTLYTVRVWPGARADSRPLYTHASSPRSSDPNPRNLSLSLLGSRGSPVWPCPASTPRRYAFRRTHMHSRCNLIRTWHGRACGSLCHIPWPAPSLCPLSKVKASNAPSCSPAVGLTREHSSTAPLVSSAAACPHLQHATSSRAPSSRAPSPHFHRALTRSLRPLSIQEDPRTLFRLPVALSLSLAPSLFLSLPLARPLSLRHLSRVATQSPPVLNSPAARLHPPERAPASTALPAALPFVRAASRVRPFTAL